MDHMNLFLPFEHRDYKHEDFLTRNYLYLLKALPEMRDLFISHVSSQLRGAKIPSAKFLNEFEVLTQVDSGNELFDSIVNGTHVVSILVSDDIFEDEHQVDNSDRHARYDGVVRFNVNDGDKWLLIIENKPCVGDVWTGQLDLNLGDAQSRVDMIKRPCYLSWRKLIDDIGNFLTKSDRSLPAKMLVADFLMYVNEKYPKLKPYDTFRKCGGNRDLLRRRCHDILQEFNHDVAPELHKGWEYYAESGDKRIKQIALGPKMKNGGWTIDLMLCAGPTMSSAREVYRTINVERLEQLLEHNRSFSIHSGFHFSFRISNLTHLYLRDDVTVRDYIRYWKEHQSSIFQLKREQFEDMFKKMLRLGFASKGDRRKFDQEIMAKKYTTLNVCPEFVLTYSWASNEAERLDDAGKFVEDLRRVKELAFSIFD